MKTRFSFAIAAAAFVVLFATPAVAQEADAEKEEAAAQHAEMMEGHAGMMAEGKGCQCECMQEMHEKMMQAHADSEGHEGMEEHADGEGHEGMEGDEAHAEMMETHKEMMADCECMADCKCMSGEMGEGEHAMGCKMHGAQGRKGHMKGEGKQYRHDADTDGDAAPETPETDGDN